MVLLNSESKKDIELLIKIASKMGIHSQKMTAQQKEDYALGVAIKKGKTNQYVNTNDFVKQLRKKVI